MPFTDKATLFLPPSFKEFMRDEENWLRPDAYIREVVAADKYKEMRQEKHRLLKKKK